MTHSVVMTTSGFWTAEMHGDDENSLVCQAVRLSGSAVREWQWQCVCLVVCLSGSMPLWQCVCVAVYLSDSVSIWQCVCLAVCLSGCLSVG